MVKGVIWRALHGMAGELNIQLLAPEARGLPLPYLPTGGLEIHRSWDRSQSRRPDDYLLPDRPFLEGGEFGARLGQVFLEAFDLVFCGGILFPRLSCFRARVLHPLWPVGDLIAISHLHDCCFGSVLSN